MRMLLGTTAALVLAAATPAAALTLTFTVSVESVNDQSDFIPFSFQETWTWNPTYSKTGLNQQDLVGQATVDGPTLVTDNQAALAQVDLGNPDATDSRLHYIEPNTLVFGLRTQASSASVIFEGEKGSFDDVVREGFYSRGIGLGIFGTETFSLDDISDEAQVRAFLTGRSLSWSEFAGFRLVTGDGPHFDPYENRTYLGTATLVSDAGAVPEPATWALMIAGFAGIGVTLRGRRMVAVA